jgi:hypothetical protein
MEIVSKLIIEKRGDTMLKHYIDLTGKKRRGFDNTYTAVCVYRNITNKPLATSDAYLSDGDFTIYFDRNVTAHFCDSILKSMGTDTQNVFAISSVRKCKKYMLGGDLGAAAFNTDLILNCSGYVVHNETHKPLKSILVEFYTTEFSSGENFLAITESGDTQVLFHHNVYMK